MKFCIVVILHIFGVIHCDSSNSAVVDKNTFAVDQNEPQKCDQKDIEYLSVRGIFHLAVENEGCRNEAMEDYFRTILADS